MLINALVIGDQGPPGLVGIKVRNILPLKLLLIKFLCHFHVTFITLNGSIVFELIQGERGEPGQRGDKGESGQPVSKPFVWLFIITFLLTLNYLSID